MSKKSMILLIILGVIILILLFYGYLWLASSKKYPVEYGISFNKNHTEYIGLDWKQTYLAMLDELKPKYIRISATWSETEPERGVMDSADVDWQMFEAAKRGVKVALVVGQKAPRWPECHVPGWADELSDEDYKKFAREYVEYVVKRYRNHPALDIWQVENEPFIRFRFGACKRFDENLAYGEINLVRSLDHKHKIMVTDSGELSNWRQAIKAGDIFGTTLYRIVKTPYSFNWNYDWLPASFYRLKAKFWGRSAEDVFVSELQAEPWFSDSDLKATSLEKQKETMNLERMKKHFDYVERTGFPRAYLWGVEWWYWMKEVKGDDRYWAFVKEKLAS